LDWLQDLAIAYKKLPHWVEDSMLDCTLWHMVEHCGQRKENTKSKKQTQKNKH